MVSGISSDDRSRRMAGCRVQVCATIANPLVAAVVRAAEATNRPRTVC